MGFVGRKPTNAPLTSDDIPNGIISAADLASGISGLITWQSVQTTGFTAVAGRGYPCNTTSAAFTVTLPASPSVGDQVLLLDYAGTFATNILTITSTLKINGSDNDVKLITNREATTLTYVDVTQGWVASSGVNEGTSPSLTDSPPPYSVDFLIVAGGGGGSGEGSSNAGGSGGGAGGYRNSYSTETSGGGGSSETELSFTGGTVYTVTVGAGGTGGVGQNDGVTGSNSLISGTGITTITSNGGGGAGTRNRVGLNGGSGGGAGLDGSAAGGSGTANQGFAGGNATGTSSGTGGGGASAVGANATSNTVAGNGGNGLASSITGSSVTRAGGGGGGGTSTGGTGGTGGGANGASGNANGSSASSNTGGGGGGAYDTSSGGKNGGSGGSGVVILRMPTANYSGTTTGSPTVTTSGADTILVFNSSGSITG